MVGLSPCCSMWPAEIPHLPFFDRDEHPMVLTVSLNTSYVSAVRSGRVTATGSPAGGGRKLVHVNGVLTSEEGAVIATATGVFKRHSLAK